MCPHWGNLDLALQIWLDIIGFLIIFFYFLIQLVFHMVRKKLFEGSYLLYIIFFPLLFPAINNPDKVKLSLGAVKVMIEKAKYMKKPQTFK